MKGGLRSIYLTTYKRQIIDLKLTISTGSFSFSMLPKTRRKSHVTQRLTRPSSSTLSNIWLGCRTTYVRQTDEQLTNNWGGRNWRGDNWQTTDERTDEGRTDVGSVLLCRNASVVVGEGWTVSYRFGFQITSVGPVCPQITSVRFGLTSKPNHFNRWEPWF